MTFILENQESIDDFFEIVNGELKALTGRSAWAKGVSEYAEDLISTLQEHIEGGYFDAEDLEAPKLVEKEFLNGAPNWHEYSWGGCSLIYDSQIAKRLCPPSLLKKSDNGRRRPNRQEEWLDVQVRALFQANILAKKAVRNAVKKKTDECELFQKWKEPRLIPWLFFIFLT